MNLGAWWNGYEVVAATSVEEARALVLELGYYDEEDVDGDGWKRLPDDMVLCDEDGDPDGTVADVVKAVGKPCHLWSCEP